MTSCAFAELPALRGLPLVEVEFHAEDVPVVTGRGRGGLKRIAYSTASAITAALALALIGDISRIPGGALGLVGLAVLVFAIALYSYGRID